MTGAIALAICVLCPLLDMFDKWDHALLTGHDSEYPLVVLALCVGAAFILGRFIVALSLSLLTSSTRYATPPASRALVLFIRPAALAFSPGSPPLSLRI